jgi:hypothetical protein
MGERFPAAHWFEQCTDLGCHGRRRLVGGFMDRLVATGQRELGWCQVFISPGSRTNLIQPFWALPALAIAGLKAKDVMGFCLIVLIVSGVVISLGLLWA